MCGEDSYLAQCVERIPIELSCVQICVVLRMVPELEELHACENKITDVRCVCVRTYVRMYVCMHACMRVCLHVGVHVCMRL